MVTLKGEICRSANQAYQQVGEFSGNRCFAAHRCRDRSGNGGQLTTVS